TLEQRQLVGAKPPLRPKHVWSIRTKLQIAGRTRDLAMFNLAIDSKLRECDKPSFSAPARISIINAIDEPLWPPNSSSVRHRAPREDRWSPDLTRPEAEILCPLSPGALSVEQVR